MHLQRAARYGNQQRRPQAPLDVLGLRLVLDADAEPFPGARVDAAGATVLPEDVVSDREDPRHRGSLASFDAYAPVVLQRTCKGLRR